jgi:hypothetical protein
MIRASRIWLLALTAVTLAGCSSDPGTGGSPSSTQAVSSTSASAGSGLPYAGAPKITNPLPVSVLSSDPCASALTADQTKMIFGQVETGARSDSGTLGPACSWTNPETGALVLVTYILAHDGLSAVYQNTKPHAIVWRETIVQGFPAVAHLTKGSGPKEQFCTISVGIADNASADIGLTLSPAKIGTADPCSVDLQIAGMVAGNLKQKAGS